MPIPNTLFIAAVIFAIAVLTRSTVVSFIGGLVLLVGYGVSRALTTRPAEPETGGADRSVRHRTLFVIATKYWTVADKNTLTLGYSGLMLWNRLIWLGVGALVFAFAYWRFSFAERSTKPGKKGKEEATPDLAAIAIPAADRHFGPGAAMGCNSGEAPSSNSAG